MGTHPLRGYARWLVFPAISAAGGALAFVAGAAPLDWDWRMGAVLGLAPGLALAIAPRVLAGAPLAVLLAGLGALSLAPKGGFDALQPELPNLVLGGSTLAAAILQGFRLREGTSWWWPNLVLQTLAGLAVPSLMWWFNLPIETGSFWPFVVLAAGHVVAVEFATFLSPRVE